VFKVPDMILTRHFTPLLGTNVASKRKALRASFLSSSGFFNGEGILSMTCSKTLSTLRPALAEIYDNITIFKAYINDLFFIDVELLNHLFPGGLNISCRQVNLVDNGYNMKICVESLVEV
jgi:hypothetical protein